MTNSAKEHLLNTVMTNEGIKKAAILFKEEYLKELQEKCEILQNIKDTDFDELPYPLIDIKYVKLEDIQRMGEDMVLGIINSNK